MAEDPYTTLRVEGREGAIAPRSFFTNALGGQAAVIYWRFEIFAYEGRSKTLIYSCEIKINAGYGKELENLHGSDYGAVADAMGKVHRALDSLHAERVPSADGPYWYNLCYQAPKTALRGLGRRRHPRPHDPDHQSPSRAPLVALVITLMAATVAATLAVVHFSHGATTAGSSTGARPAIASAAGIDGITSVDSTNLSGYSAYPEHGTLTAVRATWDVPQVTCPSDGSPRVVVWAGLWGTNAAVADNNAWLPKAGSVSQCSYGKVSYAAIWEMDTEFPSSAIAADDPKPLPLTIRPGDNVSAVVSYLGGNSAGDRHFSLALTDNSRGARHATEEIWTNAPVPLDDIAYQGGAIVENHNQYGGLANFSQSPVHFTKFSASGGSGRFGGYQYQMIVNGQLLAQNSNLGGTFPHAASLSVTFLCNGCLAGVTCPPPSCLRM